MKKTVSSVPSPALYLLGYPLMLLVICFSIKFARLAGGETKLDVATSTVTTAQVGRPFRLRGGEIVLVAKPATNDLITLFVNSGDILVTNINYVKANTVGDYYPDYQSQSRMKAVFTEQLLRKKTAELH